MAVPVVPVVVVVAAGVLVLVVELSFVPLAVAAAAAVAMPANASKSPQARIERRNSMTSWVDCKSEAERAGRLAFRRAPLGAAYAVVSGNVADDTFVAC